MRFDLEEIFEGWIGPIGLMLLIAGTTFFFLLGFISMTAIYITIGIAALGALLALLYFAYLIVQVFKHTINKFSHKN